MSSHYRQGTFFLCSWEKGQRAIWSPWSRPLGAWAVFSCLTINLSKSWPEPLLWMPGLCCTWQDGHDSICVVQKASFSPSGLSYSPRLSGWQLSSYMPQRGYCISNITFSNIAIATHIFLCVWSSFLTKSKVSEQECARMCTSISTYLWLWHTNTIRKNAVSVAIKAV